MINEIIKIKTGKKDPFLYSKSIKGKRGKKGYIYNPERGTYHELIRDPNGGYMHLVETGPWAHCAKCGTQNGTLKEYNELWITIDCTVMLCKFCKTYIWKKHPQPLNKSYADTDFKKLKYLQDISLGRVKETINIPCNWIL